MFSSLGIQENKEEVSQTELTKLLSQEWNRLGPEKKKASNTPSCFSLLWMTQVFAHSCYTSL